MNSHKTIILAGLAVIHSMLTVIAAEDPARLAAPSLSAAASGEKAPDADGFILRWLILEPIRSNTPLTDNAINEAVKKEYFPEQLSVIPRDGDKVKTPETELAWHAVDTKEYNVNLYHFARNHGAPTSNVLFWALTIIDCPEELRDVRLAIGSNAASVWWVNGQQVIGIYGDRQTVIDDGVSKRLTLKKGANVIRCAVFNAGGATDFCARFLGADEKPLKNFNVRLNKVAEAKKTATN